MTISPDPDLDWKRQFAACPQICMQGGAAGEEPPAPKKRGRPRKNPDVVVSEADLKGKARRARPRASKVNSRLMQRSMWDGIAWKQPIVCSLLLPAC